MSRPMRRPVLLGLLFGLAWAAAGRQIYDVEIVVGGKRIAEPSVNGYTIAFHLGLRSLSDRTLELVRVDYRMVVEDVEYLRLESEVDPAVGLEAGGRTTIALPVRLSAEYLFPAVPGLRDKDLAVAYVSGGMTFRDERRRERRVPMAFSAEFPVYRGFEGGVGPVDVRTLTVGGSELTMTVLFRNLNGFPVSLGRLTYKLELVGRPVGEGAFAGDWTVDGRGTVGFPVPLTLDFFEIGKAVSDGLLQPPVAVRVSGEAEVETPWGPWRIPFDKSDKVDVLRKEGGHEPNSGKFGSCPRTD